MYELKLSQSRFLRVREGQTAAQISHVTGRPVPHEVFCGQVIVMPEGDFFVYSARVGDTYATVANKFGVSQSELENVNGGTAVYPTRRLFIPRREGH